MSNEMREFVKDAVLALTLLATVAALYLAAQQVDALPLFFAVLLLALAVALARRVWPPISRRVRRWNTAIREHELRTLRIAELEAELRDIGVHVPALMRHAEFEGRRAAAGWFLAKLGPDVELVAVSSHEGVVTLFARPTESRSVRVGARYDLELQVTGDVKGVLELTNVAEDGTLSLVCIDARASDFWEQVSTKAITDSEPPSGLRLIPAQPLPLAEGLAGRKDAARD